MNHFNKLFFVALIFASQYSVCMDTSSQPRPLKIYTKIKLSRNRTKSAVSSHVNQIGVRRRFNVDGNSEKNENAQHADSNELTIFLRNQIITAQQTLSDSKSFSENEYHILLWHCRDILNIYAQENNNVLASYTSGGIMLPAPYGPDIIKESVTEFLQAIDTPTALRLLTNLKATNFMF